ncbi:MAG: type II toxin-antitoxin system PemK/MazF family toxin [Candidatus Nealsonbacteria bacterium]|nr:type II toxin-antitoxin system PemK/MazF family toxin [Candidatus Nealsonbacteria bacterium]
MITTATRRAETEPTQFMIELGTARGRQAGLLHTSAVKCENLFTVHQDLIRRTIGRLGTAAMSEIDVCVKASLGIK